MLKLRNCCEVGMEKRKRESQTFCNGGWQAVEWQRETKLQIKSKKPRASGKTYLGYASIVLKEKEKVM